MIVRALCGGNGIKVLCLTIQFDMSKPMTLNWTLGPFFQTLFPCRDRQSEWRSGHPGSDKPMDPSAKHLDDRRQLNKAANSQKRRSSLDFTCRSDRLKELSLVAHQSRPLLLARGIPSFCVPKVLKSLRTSP